MTGPLTGLRVLEFAGIGPAPFAAMMLADAGADVFRIDRLVRDPGLAPAAFDLLNRGKRSAAIDLKHPEGHAVALDLVAHADVLLEGFRPGVMEKLDLGPDICLERNPRLVYTRVTGWGQDGPLASSAGHDIDYIAVSGVLRAIGRAGQPPVPPLNLVGDFGGGGMLAAYGVLCALLERGVSGRGQVVDAAMVDGSALLMTMIHGFRAAGLWSDERASNLLDSGAPYYDVYETADEKFLAVGAIEPQFYRELLVVLGLDNEVLPDQHDRARWPELARRFTETIRSRSLADWCARSAGTDACVAPVLSMPEAASHPHNTARGMFTEVCGIVQPAAAPRFSRTPAAVQGAPAEPGADTTALADWGVDPDVVATLRTAGVLG